MTDTWDEYVKHAQEYFDSGRLETEEIAYKREMGEDLAAARRAVLASAANWPDLLRHALRSRQGHPIAWPLLGDFNRWCSAQLEEAREALHALWVDNNISVSDRIRAFYSQFPRSELRGAVGNSTNVVSVLLMGLDVEQYPPFRVRVFNSAYERTGYGNLERGADEADLYEHALGFLDRFISEAAERKLTLRHRLDAQSVVWGMPQVPEAEADDQDRIEEVDGTKEISERQPGPDIPSLAAKLHLTVAFLENIQTLLEDKLQVIFQGPPGTGKTYVAQKLADHLAGSKERVTLVQFHPSYAYEDFVQGFRPALVNGQPGFELRRGPLLRAADRARQDPDAKHFLVIDEINRGNLAKVFGELYFLLEYRDKEMDLQYSDQDKKFSLPENLYIIGTMNTADRSIALVDLALRRRFYFVEFHPDYDPVKSVLRSWLRDESPNMEWVADVVVQANEHLSKDRHAAIGPSYFMKDGLDEDAVERIWKHSVLPYIEERLYGQQEEVEKFKLDSLKAEVTGGGADVEAPGNTQDEEQGQAGDG